ncbi:hypothetical protein [Pedobacter flavus]|uniref:Uncharacterized protein n=1 Tax=Pedobacter flavus TaxID=3113906 RepID=A0ABU7GZB1_9SPHI|nr:hypothetical protein [Pedobacter sp. VNH31]MEE1884366.1 hypothetical protein [Pedobacter sp. VNH31]
MDYQKHSEEQNKRSDQVQVNENQWASKVKRFKNHQRAEIKGTTTIKRNNKVVESMYHVILNKVKILYSTLPNKSDRVIVELNLKAHPLNVVDMHCLLTPHFLFHLEADILGNYKIEYHFHNCPFESEIKTLMKKCCINPFSSQRMNIADYNAYFKEVLRVQPEKFIHLL